jgi:hypothetical protein
MKKKWIGVTILLLTFIGMNFGAVFAQSYHFQVPVAVVNYYITNDGTATIEYIYDLVNDSGAPDIEFVDIGMPSNSQFSYSDMSAEIDGKTITHIEKSEYVTNAVEFGLGSNSIPAGKTGRFRAVIPNVRRVIYPGTAEEAEAYASTQFSPNYFESGTVSGKTDLTVTIFLPIGMTTEEPRYYPPQNWPGSEEPESGYDEDGRVYYRWQSDDANTLRSYIFGAAFPARLVPEGAITQPPSESSTSTFALGNIIDTLFGNAACCGFGIFALFFGWSIYRGTVGARKRKMKYLPPKITIEGHGIKRGLTAIEAAILMEQPMDKIMTMVLFSVVKKGAATAITREPLKVEIADPLPKDLRAYEKDFLKAFGLKRNASRRKSLQTLMIMLVKSVTKKMKGFSYKETVAYYKKIIDRAWGHVEAENTPEVKMQNLDESMDWTMLDDEYEERSRRTFSGPVFVPIWWGRYDPTFRGASTSIPRTSTPSGPGPSVSLPNLPGSDFAASVVGGIQGFSAGVIGDLRSFTSGVTSKTNPVPKSSGRYSGRSGGSSCACACACAGCACACAGGGR